MLRFLILAGYFELVMYLQVSGKLNQYINIHYSYLAYISMVLSFILAVVQLIVWMKQMKVHSHLSGRVAKVASIVLLAFPVLTGLLVPTVTLDANTVSAKGYHFPLAAGSDPNQADQEGTTIQYLKPDTSSYFTSSAYEKEMTKELAKYKGRETIQITTENYIHCIADSGVYGLATTGSDQTFKDNTWVKVTGTITVDYYQNLKQSLPILNLTEVKEVGQPDNPYVYRVF